MENRTRNEAIARVCGFNIVTTIVLATVKISAGIIAGSTAMIMDAVHYYMDVLQAGIVLVGAKLADREPDRKHPFGYGRMEYLCTLTLCVLVLYSGIQSLISSVRGLFHSGQPVYTPAAIAVLVITLILKEIIGQYTRKKGEMLQAASLTAMGKSAVRKTLFSLFTISVIIIYLFTEINLDALLGVIIAVVVLRAGLKLTLSTISRLLGSRADPALSKEIKNCIAEIEGVYGAYDLILHDYGPEKMQGSVHIEVPDTMTVQELDNLERRIARTVGRKFGVEMTGIGVYAVHMAEDEISRHRHAIQDLALKHGAMAMHGFYIHPEEKALSYDVLYNLSDENRTAAFNELKRETQELYPGYTLTIHMDLNYTD